MKDEDFFFLMALTLLESDLPLRSYEALKSKQLCERVPPPDAFGVRNPPPDAPTAVLAIEVLKD